MHLLPQQNWLKNLDYIRRDMKEDLVQFLSNPDNVEKFIGVAITESLGYELTEDGDWVKLDT